MNIFFLDKDPQIAAKYHCSKHNPKMLTEALQILSTYLRAKGHAYDFLDKSIPQAKEYVKWLDSNEDNLNWFKRLIINLYLYWMLQPAKDISRKFKLNLHIKFRKIYDYGLLENDNNSNILPASFIFRCQKEYSQPDLKNMEECTDLDRVVHNYREFYKWKNKQMKTEMKFHNGTPEWF